MSKNKPKIVKWEYVTKLFDVYIINSDEVKRVHAPIEPSLSRTKTGIVFLHLRPCVQGVDEYGAVVKYLYCTRDGRFFVRGKDGWNEILVSNHTHIRHNKAVGGSAGCPQLQHHGQKYAHRCIAVAWCNPPAEALAEINDKDAKKKWEVDHLNTDHKNWTADNLQWITADENRRRAKIARRMRKIGLDPKLLTPRLCRGIYTLPEERIEEFIGRFLMASNESVEPMDIWSICTCVAIALDIVKSQISNDQ